MVCLLCNHPVKPYKVIKGEMIFECKKCGLGFLKHDIFFRSINRSRITTGLYDFAAYRKIEGKLRNWFELLTDEIVRHKKKGRVLDVGSGYGLFSLILQGKGDFEIDLLEPEQKPQLHLKINKFYKTTFENFKNKEKYDIIIMLDVIEHFSDPIANLKKVNSFLNMNGILIIQTPNYKSLMARICNDWAWWMIEDHKYFFSPKSLQKMLFKEGFKLKYLITYEDWYDFKKNLDGNFVNIKNNLLRKFIKLLFLSLFTPLYFLTRKLIWRLDFGGLIFSISNRRSSKIAA